MPRATHKRQLTAKDKKTYLEQKLSDKGKEALNRLSEKCDRIILAELFAFLSIRDPIELPIDVPAPSLEDQSATRRRVHKISLSPLDSLDTALHPLTKEEVLKIVSHAQKMTEEIQRLKETALVRRITRDIPASDLLGGSALPNLTQSHFCTILALPQMIKTIGKKQHPDYNRRLTRIYRHIHERTGQWHDAWVADVLNDFLPDPEHPQNEDSLKQWRKRQDLVD